MQTLVHLINSNIDKYPNIILAKYECGCKGHYRTTIIGEDEKIQICKKCENLMAFECIRYDNSFCLVCMKKKEGSIRNCIMCSSCGDVIVIGVATFCRICKQKHSLCRHCLWLLCRKCVRK